MPTVLFAINGVWIAILFLAAATTVSWLLYRLVVDFAKWFNEEIIEDIRENKRQAHEKRQAMIRAQEDA
jgi:hypothetical protein